PLETGLRHSTGKSERLDHAGKPYWGVLICGRSARHGLYRRQETHFYPTKDAIWKTEPPGNEGGQASSFRLRRRPAASARKVPSGFSGERSQPKGGISRGTRCGDTGGQSRHLCHFGKSDLFRG